MKIVKLMKLSIENFKGIRNLDIDFGGKNARISGRNGTGKTSVGDAVSWLLFEKDMQGTTAIEIETKTPDGEVIHNLEHSVTAEFDIDGRGVKFQRKYFEKWTKKRGSATSEFSGHISEFFVNDVPITKKEYDFKVSEIGTPETLMNLMFTDIFTNLDWEKRREIFVNFVGGISDEEIIGTNDEFKSLEFDKYSLDEMKAMAQNNRKRINKELEALPGKIAVLKNELIDIDIDAETVEDEIKKHNRELSLLRTKRNGITNGGAVAECNLKISELKKKYTDEESEYNKRVSEEKAAAFARRDDIERQLRETERQRDSMCDYLSDIKKDKEQCEKLLESVRENFRAEKEKVYDGSDVCPCCGQRIPEDKISEAVRVFEAEKINKCQEIRARGKQLGEDIAILEDKRIKTELIIEELTKSVIPLADEHENFVVPEFPPFENKHITDEIALLEKQIDDIHSDNANILAGVDSEIAAKERVISAAQERLAGARAQVSLRNSIADLEKEQAKLGEMLESEDKTLFLVDEFILAQCNALTDKINSRFKNIRVKMFDIQVNGGISPCCDIISAKDGSNLTGSMNRGQAVNAKIEIINALSDYYGICAPVVVDDTEGVTKLAETFGQAIILRHDANEEILKIEREDN